MKVAISIFVTAIIACILWLSRWAVYDLLSLSSIVEKALYLQALPILCVLTVAIIASLIKSYKPAMAQTSDSSKTNNPDGELEGIKESLKEMQETLADLHAMGKIKQKKEEGKS